MKNLPEVTRPLGATAGDPLTKPVAKGGPNLGTVGSSAGEDREPVTPQGD